MAITNMQVVTGYYDSLGTPTIETVVSGHLSAGWIPQGAPVLTDVYGQVAQSMVKSDNLSTTAYTVATGATPMAPDNTWDTLGNPTWIESGRYLQAYTKGDQVTAKVDLSNQVDGVLPVTNGGTGVDTQSALWNVVKPTGTTLLSADPVSPLDAATKQWTENTIDDAIAPVAASVNDISLGDGESKVGGLLYAGIRAYNGTATQIKCIGRSTLKDGGEGYFCVDTADSVTADNDGIVLVDAAGRRWKRSYSGPIMATWFGVKDNADASSGLQKAVTLGGGQIFIKDGQYNISTPVTANHTGANYPVMGRRSTRFDFIGSSMANTTFNTNNVDFLSYTGTDGTVAGQGVHSGARISDFTVYGTGNTGVGLRCVGAAYMKVHDLSIMRTNIAVRLSGILSSDFKRINAQYNNYGMYITSAANSTFNAMRISGMFGANSKWGIEGEVGTNVYIEDSNFEGNGTDGDTGSGAIYLRVVEPLSTINISGYFEANVGQADILIDNRTSSPCVVNIRGAVFNRGGMRGGDNLGKGCTYNIETRHTGGGQIILNLEGCMFFTQTGFGYVPSAAKPYIKPSSLLIVNGEDTCHFSESTSRAVTGSRSMSIGFTVSASGVSNGIPPYMSVNRASTGVYTVDSQIPFATGTAYFQAVASAKVSGTTVSYVQKVSTTSLRIVTLNSSGAVADAEFDLVITSRR